MSKEKNINLKEDNLEVSYDANFDGTFEGYPPKNEEETKSEKKEIKNKASESSQKSISSDKPRVFHQKPKEVVVKKHIAESKIEAVKEEKKKQKEESEEVEEIKEKPKAKKEAKSSKKDKKQKEDKEESKNQIGFIVVLVIIAIVGILAIIGLTRNVFAPNGMAAKIYDESITLEELNKAYAGLQENIQVFTTKTQILDQLIIKKLLLIDAKNNNLEINDSEIEQEISNLISQAGMTDLDFQELLNSRNLTYEEFKQQVKEVLVINKLAKEVIFKNLAISDAEIKKYYDENIEQYTISEQVNASHILICFNTSVGCKNNRTRDDAYLLAMEIKDKVNQTNFGELAALYSEEPGATVTLGNLGYFAKGEMVKPFEDASFLLDVGGVSPKPVETPYGFHLIEVFGKKPSSKMFLSEVKDEIKITIESEKQQLLFEDYIKQLRNESETKGQLTIYFKEEQQ